MEPRVAALATLLTLRGAGRVVAAAGLVAFFWGIWGLRARCPPTGSGPCASAVLPPQVLLAAGVVLFAAGVAAMVGATRSLRARRARLRD